MSVRHEGEAEQQVGQREYVDRRPAPPSDNSNRLVGLAVLTVVILGLMVGWFWSAVGGRGLLADEPSVEPLPTAEASQEPAAAPTPAATPEATPPAPISNQLRSLDWLLSPYAVVNTGGELVITGTVTNLGNRADSATLRVYVYVDGTPVAVGSGQVTDVPADQGVEISLKTGSNWVPGGKVLLLKAEDVPAATTP